MNTGKRYLSYTLATSALTILSFAVITACSDRQAKAKANIITKPASKPGVVAKIGGEEITEEALIGEDKMDFFELKKREYELKMDRVNRLITEKLIGAEAKKANLSLDEYVNKNVLKGEIKITDAEVKKFVADKKIPESQVNDQIKERIKQFMSNEKRQNTIQAYIAKLTKSNPVEVYFDKPKMDVKVEIGNSPILGSKSAKVQIIEFSDFQCPFCSRAADTVHQVAKKYGNKVAIAFKQFPLPMHKDAKPASEAALCINEQSTDKFWKYHDLLFKQQDKMDTATLEAHAKAVGADVAKFKACFEGKKYAQAVEADMAYGEKVGVRSTPTFFVNGQIINGAVPLEQFAEVIDEELSN